MAQDARDLLLVNKLFTWSGTTTPATGVVRFHECVMLQPVEAMMRVYTAQDDWTRKAHYHATTVDKGSSWATITWTKPVAQGARHRIRFANVEDEDVELYADLSD